MIVKSRRARSDSNARIGDVEDGASEDGVNSKSCSPTPYTNCNDVRRTSGILS